MITKLIVASCKWENSNIKRMCKRKKRKEKGFHISLFRFQRNTESEKWVFSLPLFPTSGQTKHAGRDETNTESSVFFFGGACHYLGPKQY